MRWPASLFAVILKARCLPSKQLSPVRFRVAAPNFARKGNDIDAAAWKADTQSARYRGEGVFRAILGELHPNRLAGVATCQHRH